MTNINVNVRSKQWILWDLSISCEISTTYYPIFVTIKFLFYFGWLRSAETLYNPFGEDDDDFEINDLLDRHFRVALAMVDDTEDPPVLQTDIFLDVSEAALASFYQEAWAFKVGFS